MVEKRRVTTAILTEMKRRKDKITMLTAYDYSMARILDSTGVDIVLVGDSLGNVMLGYENTLPVTVADMIMHTKAVRRGVKQALLVVDMPFLSYQLSPEQGLKNAGRFIKESGAEAVKIEGVTYLETIKVMIKAGIPVMGHLGFTPQNVNQLGGYRVQGKTSEQAISIIKAAKELEKAGCFSLVLEMVPAEVAKKVTNSVKIPVIGIGAGLHCDGQVLVTHDLLGLYERFLPKFVKQYAQLAEDSKKAVRSYIREVKDSKFPDPKHSF